jgi:WD40 repeat protein
MFAESSLTIVDARTGQPTTSLARSEANLAAPAAMSRDGSTIVIADKNGHDLHVIHTKGPTKVRTMNGHSITVTSLAFTPDGKNLLAGYDDESVVWWNMAAGTPGRILPAPEPLWFSSGNGTAIISPDAGHYVTASSYYGIFDSASGKSLAAELSMTTDLDAAFSPSGKHLIYADPKAVKLLAVPSGKLLKRFPAIVKLGYSHAALSHDGKTIAIAAATLTIRDAATGAIRRTIVGGAKDLAAMAFSPDGKFLVVARSVAFEGDIQVYAAATGKPVHKLPDRSAQFAISPDSKVIAVKTDNDVGIDFVDLATGKVIKSTDTGGNPYNFDAYAEIRLVFSPDGALLAVGGPDGIMIFDAKTGKPIKQML